MYFTYCKTAVYYTRQGNGENLLLLHGWGADGRIFNSITEHYKTSHSVIVPDFPPFGLSGEIKSDYTVTAYKNLILALLDSEHISKTKIICHSFGGRVAIKLASENPERVSKIVFCSAAGLPYKKNLIKTIKKWRYNFLKFLSKKGLIKQSRLQKYFSCDYNNLPLNMKKTFVNIIKQDLTDDVKKINCPVLIVWGKDDKDTPLYMANMLNSYITGSELKVINGGHFSFLDSFKEFIAATDDFI